jgi:hypothetical protein
MATGVAWLNGIRWTERKKQKCALTSTGLLMEGLTKFLDTSNFRNGAYAQYVV